MNLVLRCSQMLFRGWGLVFFVCILLLSTRLVHAQSEWFKQPDNFYSDLKNKSHVSLVFVGQDLVSAVSFFGHTFLVFHDNDPIEPNALVVEFLGQDVNDAFDALKAGFSTIPGAFRVGFFLNKTREYQFQSRDLWIYQIKSNSDERSKMVDTLSTWRDNTSDYFKNQPLAYNFFTTNCAFYIAALLESGLNEAHKKFISNSSPQTFNIQQKNITIPLDTVRYFIRLNRVKNRYLLSATYRPAQKAFDQLTTQEKQSFLTVYDSNMGLENQPLLSNKTQFALALTARHLSTLTDDTNKRNAFFSWLKQPLVNNSPSLDDQQTEQDPALAQKEKVFRIGFSRQNQSEIKKDRIFFEITPALRSFYHPVIFGAETASLKTLASQWSISREKNTKQNQQNPTYSLRLDQLNIWQVETFVPESIWQKGVNQYLDFSYYDWHNWSSIDEKTETAKELTLRLGVGISNRFITGTRLGGVAYTGIRHKNNGDNVGLSFDIGAKWFIYQKLSEFELLKKIFPNNTEQPRVLWSQTYYHNSPFSFDRINELSVIFYEKNGFSLSLENKWLGKLSDYDKNRQWILSANINF